MRFEYHANLTLGALRRWFVAQCYDALAVSGLWLAAMLWLKVPGAFVWAALAGILQFIPHFGPPLALFGPSIAMLFAGAHWEQWLWFLGAYAGINLLDIALLQPFFMRREARIPMWASLLVPILLGIAFPFWGVLLAPPLLAIIFAYRGVKTRKPAKPQGQQFSEDSEGIVLPPEKR